MKSKVLIVLSFGLLVGSTSFAYDDKGIWDALTGTKIVQLPTDPHFKINEEKEVGRLYCSHTQWFGHEEVYNCLFDYTPESDEVIWRALTTVKEVQLPTTPSFKIGEAKEVERLYCSHSQQFGQNEVFACGLTGGTKPAH